MGFKNNTIEYGFGQMGSILICTYTNAVTARDVNNSIFKDRNAVLLLYNLLKIQFLIRLA